MEGRDRWHRRRLFGPWLIEQINSNKFEGLRWVNVNPPMFCIPWKHLTKDTSEEDYKIFKAWAIEGGKYSEHCEDPSKWKTNFRCILENAKMENIKIFTKVKNKPLDVSDFYKVYQLNCLHDLAAVTSHANYSSFNDSQEEGANTLRSSSSGLCTRAQLSQASEDILKSLAVEDSNQTIDALLQDLQLYSTQNGCTHESQQETGVIHDMANDPMENDYNPLWARLGNAAMSTPTAELPKENLLDITHLHIAVTTGGAQDQEMLLLNNPANNEKEELQRYLAKYSEGNENVYQPLGEEVGKPAVAAHESIQNGSSPSAVLFPQMYFPHPWAAASGLLLALEWTILYRGRQVLWQQVNSPCQLGYNSMTEPSLSHFSKVCFPCPNALPDQKQAAHTRRVLEKMGHGLLLEVDQGNAKIHATWLGTCKLYWAYSKQLENLGDSLEPRRLRHQMRTEIFNFNHFWTELQGFKAGQCGSPDYTICFSFGQNFSKKRLVQVKLMPSFCVVWHEIAQRHGASSLNSKSLSLQLSNSSFNSLYDLIDSCAF